MRRIIVRWTGGQDYSDAFTAIHESKKIDSERRSISDQEVRGTRIEKALWGDSSLVLELGDGRFLNFIVDNGRIAGSVGSIPEISSDDADGTICLEMDIGAFEWNRGELATRYVGKVIEGLWFEENGILLYVRGMPILACNVLEVFPERRLMLFWAESD